MSMLTLTRAFGTAFIVLGVGSWLVTGADSPTALLPAALGVLLWVCALLATREALRKHAMHAAVLIALLGLIGSLPGLRDLPAVLAGEDATRSPGAMAGMGLTILLSAAYIALAVRSFIRARQAQG